MEIDCALAVGVATPEHVALAEELGYARAWCHEAPRSYGDLGMALAVAAERTSRIRLGLTVGGHWRRAAADAEQLADLAARAPGRAELVVGSAGRDPGAHAGEVRGLLDVHVPAWLGEAGTGVYLPQPHRAPTPRGSAMRAIVEVDLDTDLERLVRRLRPAGLLVRPRTADVGMELAVFAEAVRSFGSRAA